MRLKIKTAPTVEPITANDLRYHGRIDAISPEETAYLQSCIKAAREYVEGISGRALMTQTWLMYLDAFPAGSGEIIVPLGTLQAIVAVSYKNSGGVTTALTVNVDYLVDDIEPARIVPAYGKGWASFVPFPINPVAVEFRSGWASADLIPAELKQAILILALEFYEQRQITIQAANVATIRIVDQLISNKRLWDFKFDGYGRDSADGGRSWLV